MTRNPTPARPPLREALDVVDGDPPAPLSVWLTPAEDGDTAANAGFRTLAGLLCLLYTHDGDLVIDATAEPAVADAARRMGCRHHTATPTRLNAGRLPQKLVGKAALVILTFQPDDNLLELLEAARTMVRRGGCVAVIVNDGEAAKQIWQLSVAAKTATLRYLQHHVCVFAATDGDALTAPPWAIVPDGGRHARVHHDAHVYTRNGDHHGGA